MDDTQIKLNIANFLKTQDKAVISTFDSETGKPEAALVGFAETETLELIFGTYNTTRKYKNIQSNSNVALVIGFSTEGGSCIQYEGVARELSSEEVDRYAEILILKNTQSAQYRSMPEQRYFLVQPTWIRYLDTSLETGGTYEVSF